MLCATCCAPDEGAEIGTVEHYARTWGGVDPERDTVRGILQALESADIAELLCPRGWALINEADRYAIARMGAAAWLAARVAP